MRISKRAVVVGLGLCAGLMLAPMVPVTAKKVTLRYWIWDNNQLPAVKQMVALFNKSYPDITIKTEVTGDYWTKLLTAMAAGAAPDVFWMNMPTFSVWGRRKMLLDLQPYIDADKEAQSYSRGMWKTLTGAYSVNGHLFGFPRDYDTICVLYNEDMMKAAGLVPPMEVEDKWDWNTLTEYAKKLTIRQNNIAKQWGFLSYGSDQECYLNFVYSNGGEVFKWNEDGTDSFVMDTPQSEQALKWLVDKRFKESVSPMDGYGDSLFTQGKLGMFTRGDWGLISLNKAAKKFAWNIAQLPTNPANGKRVSVIHGLADVINPSSKYRKEAFTFIKFMASKETQAILGNTGTVIPSRSDVENLFFSPKLGPSNRKAYEKATDYSKPYPMSRKVLYQYALQTLTPWVDKIFLGKIPVRQGLDGMAKDMAVVIKRYSK